MRTFGFPEFMFILEAARWTLALSLIAFIGGAVLGLIIALMRTSDSMAARRGSTVFIQIFQGTPLLLQLFLIFFGAPVLGFDINPWFAAGVALILNSAAFLGEIWRGCIEAVPSGQREAAEALSLKYVARMRDVVLPQAFKIALAASRAPIPVRSGTRTASAGSGASCTTGMIETFCGAGLATAAMVTSA